jgi:hypothetical protein
MFIDAKWNGAALGQEGYVSQRRLDTRHITMALVTEGGRVS